MLRVEPLTGRRGTPWRHSSARAAIRAGATIPAESAFGGTVSMFTKASFVVVADRASDPSKIHPRVVVRCELGTHP
jgi:hypothetical protein